LVFFSRLGNWFLRRKQIERHLKDDLSSEEEDEKAQSNNNKYVKDSKER